MIGTQTEPEAKTANRTSLETLKSALTWKGWLFLPLAICLGTQFFAANGVVAVFVVGVPLLVHVVKKVYNSVQKNKESKAECKKKAEEEGKALQNKVNELEGSIAQQSNVISEQKELIDRLQKATPQHGGQVEVGDVSSLQNQINNLTKRLDEKELSSKIDEEVRKRVSQHYR